MIYTQTARPYGRIIKSADYEKGADCTPGGRAEIVYLNIRVRSLD